MVLIGRITKDATLLQLKDERKVLNFTVALNDWYKSKGKDEAVQVTTYVNCSYWINPELKEKLTKGALVELSGRIYVTAYKTMDGEAKGSLNCHVNSIKIHHAAKTSDTFAKKEEAVADNLPF